MLQEHTTSAFDADIDAMRSVVITMGGLVEKQFGRAIEAVRHGDLRLTEQVLIDEQIVDRLHLQCDILCSQILARRQPLAVDLRQVLSAMHSVNDLERVGDEAKKIALKARDLTGSAQRLGLPVESIVQIADDVRRMLEKALDAFVHHDPSVSTLLEQADRIVDAQRTQLRAELIAWMVGAQDPDTVAAGLDLIFVVQSIERIGDHAKNIAQYVVRVVEGVDLRHRGD